MGEKKKMGARSSKQINPIGQVEDEKIVNSTAGLCPTSIESHKDLEKLEEVNEQGDPKKPQRSSFCHTLYSWIVSVTWVLLVVYIFWVYSSKASIIDSLSDEVETQRKDFTRKVAIFEEQSGEFAREIEDFESQIKTYEAELKFREMKHDKSLEKALSETEKFKVKIRESQDKISLLEKSLKESSERLAQLDLEHQDKLGKMGETKEALLRDVEDLKMLNRALVAQITELTEANTKLSDDKINLTVINSKITDYNAKLDKDYNEMVFEKETLADQINTLQKQIEQLQKNAAEKTTNPEQPEIDELEAEPELEEFGFDDSESDYPDSETTEKSLFDLFRSPQPDEPIEKKPVIPKPGGFTDMKLNLV